MNEKLKQKSYWSVFYLYVTAIKLLLDVYSISNKQWYSVLTGQEQADGCSEACLKHAWWAEDLHALSKELLWTVYPLQL